MSALDITYQSNFSALLEDIVDIPAGLNTRVHGLTMDSRSVKKGDLFIAVSPVAQDREKHTAQAIEKGASAVLSALDASGIRDAKCKVKEQFGVIRVDIPGLDNLVGQVADRFYLSPSAGMSVIGVTGTNGKTSVSNYLSQALSGLGVKTGVIGTLGYGFASEGGLTDVKFTTPDAVNVHRCLAELKAFGAKAVAMEVSSHALEQKRVDGVRFEGAIFTNLSQDHLDYHGTMEAYLGAKLKLFAVDSLRYAIVNQDDPVVDKVKASVGSDVDIVSYSVGGNADIEAKDICLDHAISAKIFTPSGERDFEAPLVGEFNLSNCLAVVSVLFVKGLLPAEMDIFKSIKPVCGRMEPVIAEGKALVVIDYAHTPDALEKVLVAIKNLCSGSVVLVFGCGGDRDVGKRAQMGRIAEQYADVVFVTDDNPRTELPEQIVANILEGVSQTNKFTVLHNRSDAITHALDVAAEKDWVLIAGKGHETYQEINGVRHGFSDHECIHAYYANLGCETNLGVSRGVM